MNKRIPLVLMIAALVVLYVGERVFIETPRYVALSLGCLLLVAALATSALRFLQSGGEARTAYRRTLVHYVLTAVAVVLYFAQTKEWALVPAGNAQVVVQVLWPALLLLALAPAVAMERAVAATERAGVVELYRVTAGARAARIVVLAIIAFAGVNYAANVWNRKVDLSYFKTTKPSEATLTLVKGLAVPVELLLFYPQSNEVLEQVKAYTDELARVSDKVSVRVVDQALDIDLAKQLKVRANGVLFVRANGHDEQLKIDLDLDEARNALKTLDVDIHNRILKAVRPKRTAYFTTGHGERDYAAEARDGRMTLADFRTLIETQGFTSQRLGLTDGLGVAVPDDATILVICGAAQPFLEGEREAVQNYLARGGRLLLMVDPEDAAANQPIADLLGVKIGNAPLATDNARYLVRLQDRAESPYYWASNMAATHASLATLNKSGGRAPVVFIGATRVTKQPNATLNVSPTLRSMSDFWEDANKNNAFEAPETRATFDVAVAVEGSVPAAKAEAVQHPGTARAVVVGDSDTAATGIVVVEGNAVFYVDSIRWLAGDDQIVGLTESEKDVPIVHRKEKDTVWFYGTSFLVPAAVLGVGLTLSKRARRVKRDVEE